MATTHWPVYSPIAKEHYGRGKAEAEVADARKLIQMVLKARGLELSESERNRVADCADLDQLNKWAEASITATSTGDVFG